ncbi:MAG: hypothetical protein V3V05_11430 [Pontiella sp.]
MKASNKKYNITTGVLLGFGMLLGSPSANAQYYALYTNVTDGGSVTLSQSVSVDSALLNTNAAGIVFDGDGTLQDPGGISVYNTATSGNPGSLDLAGIVGDSITNQNLGAVTVVNNQSAYAGNLDSSVEASGINATLVGDLGGNVSVTARGGKVTVPGGTADAYTGAYGVYEVEGSVSSAISAAA